MTDAAPAEELLASGTDEQVRAIDPPDEAVLAERISEVIRGELDQVVPHVVTALRRHDGVAELARRLDVAEKRLADRDARPMVSRLYRLLGVVQRLEMDGAVRDTLEAEIGGILTGAGYETFGAVGEAFRSEEHEVLEGSAESGDAQIVEVYEPGLKTLGEVVVRARVRVGSAQATDASEEQK